jgi:hypothetical protein
MKARRLWTLMLSLVLLQVLALAAAVYAAGPDRPAKPDKNRPVRATDIELVKKITMRGRPPWAGGGKPSSAAATGVVGESVDGERYAVVVGISDYPGTANDLRYCDDDALEMAEALTDVYRFTNVTLLLDLAATRFNILDAIDDIPADAGEIVFFFSGHGMSGKADDGDREKQDEALVAHDGEQIVPIWDGELAGAFAGFETSRVIFVFDTCLAGGMEGDLSEPGRVIAMATNEKGYAVEGDAWGHGEFTYYFVDQGILQGKANVHDYDEDGLTEEPEWVTVEEAFDYAKSGCVNDRPTIGDDFGDDLLP